jgi:hypothetical protein
MFEGKMEVCVLAKKLSFQVYFIRNNLSDFGGDDSGTERSDKYDKFYAVKQSLFSTVNTIIKGKWERKALKRVGNCGVQVDLNSRSVMGRAENFKLNVLELRSRLLGFFPAKYRRKIRSRGASRCCLSGFESLRGRSLIHRVLGL